MRRFLLVLSLFCIIAIPSISFGYGNECPRCNSSCRFVKYETSAFGVYAIYECLLCHLRFIVK